MTHPIAATPNGALLKAERRAGRLRLESDVGQLCVASVVIVASTVAASLFGSQYWAHTFELVNIFIAAAVFQNFLMDDAGQVSFGQGAVLGAAAYCAAVLTGVHGLPFALSALAGVIAALGMGLLTAFPALRVQGYYLGFVTLSGALVFPELLQYFSNYTNGIVGVSFELPVLTDPLMSGVSIASVVCAVMAILALVFHVVIRRTRLGRQMRVAANSPEAARSLGISPGLMRCIAFAISAVGTGVAGIVFLPSVGFVGPSTFGLDMSILLFFAVIVGGQGNILSPVVGVWVMYIVPSVLLVDLVQYRMFAYGALTLAIMMLCPTGLVGNLVTAMQRRRPEPTPDLHISGMFPETISNRSSTEATAVAEPTIVIQGVRKTFGKVAALSGVDLTILKGEVHALVGLNGSGKTTLLNMLCGFGHADSGSIRINGHDVSRMAAHEIARRGVARTFQTPQVFSGLSLWENVQIGADARSGSIDNHRDLKRRLMESWGAKRVTGLSHGQRRLLEVVRILLSEKELLLLDEPAAGLSPDERTEFGVMVRDLCANSGRTLVIVEHDLELVWSVADRISVMRDGRVVASGRPQDIIDDPAAEGLFSL